MYSEQIKADSNLEDIKNRMWKTKGSRFNAHSRLLIKYNWSIGTIASSSIMVIIITILPFIFTFSTQKGNIISIFTFIYALFILIFSLIEGFKNHQLKAMQLHCCATEIAALYDRLQIVLSCENTQEKIEKYNEIKDIIDKYSNTIKKCPENHETIDYDLLRLRNKKDFKIGEKEALGIYIKSKMLYLPYILSICVPLILIVILLIVI